MRLKNVFGGAVVAAFAGQSFQPAGFLLTAQVLQPQRKQTVKKQAAGAENMLMSCVG